MPNNAKGAHTDIIRLLLIDNLPYEIVLIRIVNKINPSKKNIIASIKPTTEKLPYRMVLQDMIPIAPT
jgi:hypothetical protein